MGSLSCDDLGIILLRALAEISMTKPFEQSDAGDTSISVALCTYNGSLYLREQLASIAAQTRKPAELVACDDGSRDEARIRGKLFQDESHARCDVSAVENDRDRAVAEALEACGEARALDRRGVEEVATDGVARSFVRFDCTVKRASPLILSRSERTGGERVRTPAHTSTPELVEHEAREVGIALEHCPLDLDRASDRIDNSRELGQQPVAGGFDDAAAVLVDLGIDELAAMRLEAFELCR